MRAPLTVPYGCADVPAAASVPTIALAPGDALRLGGGGYAFAEPPDPTRLRDAAARLTVVREHLESLCDLWARPQRAFLAAYVALVAQCVAAQADALAARIAPFGGLYSPADFAFAALRPLPRAHLPTGDAAAPWAGADFLFWTGTDMIALDIADGRRTRRRRAADQARLRDAGATVLELPPGLDATALAHHLPAPLLAFCAGVALPPSPFASVRLGAIVDAEFDGPQAAP